MIDRALDFLFEHWAFAAAWGLFYLLGIIVKRNVLSPEQAERVPLVRSIRRWFPLPLHPVAAGVALGLIPGVPVPEVIANTPLGPSFYFMAAGLLSVFWHDIYREFRKYEGSAADDSSNPGISIDDLRSLPPPPEEG